MKMLMLVIALFCIGCESESTTDADETSRLVRRMHKKLDNEEKEKREQEKREWEIYYNQTQAQIKRVERSIGE